MLAELSNPSIIYPFYNIPTDVQDSVLQHIRNIKRLQIAIGLYKKVQHLSLQYNTGTKTFIVVDEDNMDNRLLIEDISNYCENEVFYFDPKNSYIQYSSDNSNSCKASVVLDLLPQVLLIYPVLLDIKLYSKPPVTTAAQNSNSFQEISQISKITSGYNCDVSYTDGTIFLNAFTSAGKGTIRDLSIYKDYSGSSDSCQIQNQEGFYTINGQFGDITLSFGNSISVIYASDSATTINKKLTIKLGKNRGK